MRVRVIIASGCKLLPSRALRSITLHVYERNIDRIIKGCIKG